MREVPHSCGRDASRLDMHRETRTYRAGEQKQNTCERSTEQISQAKRDLEIRTVERFFAPNGARKVGMFLCAVSFDNSVPGFMVPRGRRTSRWRTRENRQEQQLGEVGRTSPEHRPQYHRIRSNSQRCGRDRRTILLHPQELGRARPKLGKPRKQSQAQAQTNNQTNTRRHCHGVVQIGRLAQGMSGRVSELEVSIEHRAGGCSSIQLASFGSDHPFQAR